MEGGINMRTGYYRCIHDECRGFIIFDSTDLNLAEAYYKNQGIAAKPKCNQCGREYLAVVGCILVGIDEQGKCIEEAPSCCMSEYMNHRDLPAV